MMCNNHRVDFTKLQSGLEKFVPNSTEHTQNSFVELLKFIEVMDFGSFDELEPFLKADNGTLDSLNITEVADFV